MVKWLLTTLLLFSVVACGPECLRGHTVPYWVPPHTDMYPMTIGDVTVMVPIDSPGYWTTQFVCDQYRAEKNDEASKENQ